MRSSCLLATRDPVPFLYKYASGNTGRIVLENRTLRWSTPPVLNDPFDMQFAFQVRLNRPAAKAKTLQKSWDAHYGPEPAGPRNKLGQVITAFRGKFPKLTRQEFDREFGPVIDQSIDTIHARISAYAAEIRESFANDKILSLAQSPDSVLMWAYYAQNHSGMVLRFRDVAGVDSPWKTARAVRYVDEVPSLFDDESLSDMLSGGAMDHRRVMDIVCFTKSCHWAHEREWRIYSGAGRTRGAYEDIPFNAAELDGVIFGCRMPEHERQLIADLVRKRYPAVMLLQAKTRNEYYRLTIGPL